MALQLLIKAKKTSLKPTTIYIRYSYKDKECRFSTGLKITPKDWDPAKGLSKRNLNLNKLINKKTEEIANLILTVLGEGLEPYPDVIKTRYVESIPKKSSSSLFVAEWKSFLKHKGNFISNEYLTSLKASLTTFEEFLVQQKKLNLSLSGFTSKVYDNYVSFLNNKYLQNTVAKKLKHLKGFLKSIQHPLSAHVHYREIVGDKIFLTEQELKILESADLSNNPRLERVRDLFLFQCHSGLRVSDLKRISISHIQDRSLIIRAQKNRERIEFPITPTLNRILQKYQNRIPKISEQKYNDYLKELTQLLIPDSKVELTEYKANQSKNITIEKWKVITSHVAIKTFITLRANRGMPITSIASLTGKTIQVILKSYLGYNSEQVKKDALKYDIN